MRELNWKPGQAVEMSVLDDTAGSGPDKRSARLLEFSGRRMRLAAEWPGAPAAQGRTAVRLEWDGQLVLGEVLHAEPGGFWMEIHHMLLDATDLGWQKNGWQRG